MDPNQENENKNYTQKDKQTNSPSYQPGAPELSDIQIPKQEKNELDTEEVQDRHQTQNIVKMDLPPKIHPPQPDEFPHGAGPYENYMGSQELPNPQNLEILSGSHPKFDSKVSDELLTQINSGGMFNENDIIPGFSPQNISNFPFSGGQPSPGIYSNTFSHFPENTQPPPERSLFSSHEPSEEPLPDNNSTNSLPAQNEHMPDLYSDMSQLPSENYEADFATDDSKLRPGNLSNTGLRKELDARGLPFCDEDRASNVGHLVNYLLERDFGESDLSSDSGEAMDYMDDTAPTRRDYALLEVILISCDSERRAILDWLENWKAASRSTNSAEIFELAENNLIKIRIYNRGNSPSAVINQLKQAKIKCARYYAFSRGADWGGWEFYQDMKMQKSDTYSADRPPPLFWKRLCWLENLEGGGADAEMLKEGRLGAEQVCSMLGTREVMICVDCGNQEKVCLNVHGSFNGHFKHKDLYDRYASLIGS